MGSDYFCVNCMNRIPVRADVCPMCGFHQSSYMPRPHHIPPMTILKGRYLLGKILGEGGFGITYIANDLTEDRRVAIKELYITGLLTRRAGGETVIVDKAEGSLAYYKECKEKFLQEASILYELEDKQGIVNIYDFFGENNTAYIVMEYLGGEDLKVYLKKHGGTISFDQTFALLRPIMNSLIGMHKRGIFHRDISPDNIRCLANGSMKVMDFGSAKYNYSDQWSKIVLVKPGYAPPEQYSSGYKVGPWMDVYAIAATFYRCIVGSKPKESISRTDDKDIMTSEFIKAQVTRRQRAVIAKGLSLHTEIRYQDMMEFYAALKKVSSRKKSEGNDGIRKKEHAGYSSEPAGPQAGSGPGQSSLKEPSSSSSGVLPGNSENIVSSDVKGFQMPSDRDESREKTYQRALDEMNNQSLSERNTGILIACLSAGGIGIALLLMQYGGVFDQLSRFFT